MAATTVTGTTRESDARGRGRPREFDPDQVLERVVALFWAQGFEATSMSDLVEATGLNKSSIYNSFGSKESLFRIAVQRYIDMRCAMLRAALHDGTAGLGDLHGFLELARAEAGGEMGSNGCLAVNMTTELGGSEEVFDQMSAQYRNELRTGFRAALDRAVSAGEIAALHVEAYAEVLVAFVLSLAVFTRGAAPAEEIDRQFDAIRTVIDSWRIA